MVIRLSEKEAAKSEWLPEEARATEEEPITFDLEGAEERIKKLQGELHMLERRTYDQRKELCIKIGTELNQVKENLVKRGEWGKWLREMNIASKTQQVYRVIADKPYLFDEAGGDISKIRVNKKKKPDPPRDPGEGENVSLTQNPRPDPPPGPVNAIDDLIGQLEELVDPLDLKALSESEHKVLEVNLDWLATFCLNKVHELHEGEMEEWTFDLSALCKANGALSPN